MPPPLRWLIEGRCLAKDPAERYAATQDLARELRDLRERLSGSDASPSSPQARFVSAVRWRRAARVATAGILAVAVFWGARALWNGAWGGAGPLPDRSLVVAVLPLTNLTGDAQYDATAAGIVQVVVDALSQVDGLEVMPRASTVAFADRKSDLPGIARALDAGYLVDGVLQRSRGQSCG